MKAAKRNKLKKSQFALPGSRRFPIDTRKRAANAKARATQQANKGKISKGTAAKIHARANKVLNRKRGK